MKRRDFLKTAAPATVLPFMLGGFSLKAFADNPFLHSLIQGGSQNDRVLVIIQLVGGNDGLQTVVPLDQYDAIMAARSNIAIAESQLLKLTDTIGLHPNLSGIRSLYDQNKLAIIQNVGYPQPNFSHFRSIDIWLSAADFDQVLQTGWLGRYLDQEYPGFPTGYPNATMPDPIAIQIGSAVSLALLGTNGNMGMSFSDPTAFSNVINGTTSPTPNTRAGHELAYVRSVGDQLQSFATPVKTAASKGKTLSGTWPTAGSNVLADQLRIVASLVAGGLKTKLYLVSLGGFDSHTDQRKNQDPLLAMLSTAVAAFQDELTLNALEDRVIGMTFSEFGRRIISNSSGGTDHGAAAPVFVFGSKVIGGIQGHNPVLPAKATVDDNLEMQFDFRSIYASLLSEWFGASDPEITNTLLRSFPTLPIIQPASGVTPPASAITTTLLQNYPNPFSGVTTISFTLGSADHVSIRVFDMGGREVALVADRQFDAGPHEIRWDAGTTAAGEYLCRMETNGASYVRQMIVQ